jgi:hypothetical protein
VLIVVALIAGGAALGWTTYNAGLARGASQVAGSAAVPQGGPPFVPFYGYGPYGFHPFGLGFGFLGCLVPLFFFFLIFSLIRLVFWGRMGWRGPMGWGHHGPGELHGRWRDMAEEWHRQAHAGQDANASKESGPTL